MRDAKSLRAQEQMRDSSKRDTNSSRADARCEELKSSRAQELKSSRAQEQMRVNEEPRAGQEQVKP